MICPCKNAKNINWHGQDILYDHLICSVPAPLYENRILEVSQFLIPNSRNNEDIDLGLENDADFRDNLQEMLYRVNGPNVDAKKFYSHLYDGWEKNYPLRFIVT